MSKAGLTKDPLVAGKEFISRIQREGETVHAFTVDLKLLFSQAYLSEMPTSGILLQCFLTGRGKLTLLEQAIKDAGEIKVSFETTVEPLKEINMLPTEKEPTELEKLQETDVRMARRAGDKSERERKL